jgi:hypothetical protein
MVSHDRIQVLLPTSSKAICTTYLPEIKIFPERQPLMLLVACTCSNFIHLMHVLTTCNERAFSRRNRATHWTCATREQKSHIGG